MQKKEYIPFDELDLYELLKKIRNDGLIRQDETRLLMDAIVGRKVEWTRQHCRDFFATLLHAYLSDMDLELLLATSGYGEGYDGKYITEGRETYKNNAARRRERYKSLNPGAAQPAGLRIQEHRKLQKMAGLMAGADYKNGKLLRLIVDTIKPEELIELGLNDLVPEEESERIQKERTIQDETNVSSGTGKDATSVTFPIYAVKRNTAIDFIGREDMLEALSEGFKDKSKRKIIILSGMGGVGKTQVALKYAETSQDEYDAVFWLNAASAETLDNTVSELLAVYDSAFQDETNVSFITGKDATVVASYNRFQRFLNKLTGKKLLIIYDNADYLNEKDETEKKMQQELISYMPDGNCHIIITSRCNVPFNNGELIQLDVFKPETAEQYLEKKAGKGIDPEAKELARRLGYLPLALCYAGAYIRMNLSSYGEYLELWDEYGMTLFDGKDYAEKTLRTVFDITLNKLKDLQVIELLNSIGRYSGEYFPLNAYISLLEKGQELAALQMEELIKKYPEDFLNEKGLPKYAKLPFMGRVDAGDPPDKFFDEPISDSLAGDKRPYGGYLKALKNKIRRNEMLKQLEDYSLIQRDGMKIYIHPMLQEYVQTGLKLNLEIPEEEQKRSRLAQKIWNYEILAALYKEAGDDELTERYNKALDEVKDEYDKLSNKHNLE